MVLNPRASPGMEPYLLVRRSEREGGFNTLGVSKNIEGTRAFLKPYIEDQKNEQRKLVCWAIINTDENDFIGLTGMNLSANRFKTGEIYY